MEGYTHILLMGEYNFPENKWEENTARGSEQSTAAKFFDATQYTYLYQHIIKPTRQRSGQQTSTLDLVFSKGQYMFDSVTHLAPLGYSDHESLRGSYICYVEAPANKRLSGSRNYPKGDYDVSTNPRAR